jgi:DNA topoisomerase IB
VKETAETLGNTPAVSRNSYISPAVVRAFEAGRVIRHPVVAVSELATSRGRLHHCERSLIRVLEEFGATTARRG